jgi:hypothetical protein
VISHIRTSFQWLPASEKSFLSAVNQPIFWFVFPPNPSKSSGGSSLTGSDWPHHGLHHWQNPKPDAIRSYHSPLMGCFPSIGFNTHLRLQVFHHRSHTNTRLRLGGLSRSLVGCSGCFEMSGMEQRDCVESWEIRSKDVTSFEAASLFYVD